MSLLAVAISMTLLISMLSIAEGLWQVAVEDVSKGREDIVVTSSHMPGASRIQYGHEFSDRLRSDTGNISEAAPFDVFLLHADHPSTDVNGTVVAMGLIPERSARM